MKIEWILRLGVHRNIGLAGPVWQYPRDYVRIKRTISRSPQISVFKWVTEGTTGGRMVHSRHIDFQYMFKRKFSAMSALFYFPHTLSLSFYVCQLQHIHVLFKFFVRLKIHLFWPDWSMARLFVFQLYKKPNRLNG